MVKVAILHGTLPQLLAQSSSSRAAGIDVTRSAADVETFRTGLASQRVDALVLSLDLLGTQPVREIDRLRKYTRARAAIVTHNCVAGQVLRAVEDRVDLVIVREPLTPTRLRGLLARVLEEPELATEPQQPRRSARAGTHNALFDGLIEKPVIERRYDDVQISQIFEEAIARNFEFTYHTAEMLTHLTGLEDYCRRRNAGKDDTRGLNHDVERAVSHARGLLEEAVARLNAATHLIDEREYGNDSQDSDTADNVHPLHRGISGSASTGQPG